MKNKLVIPFAILIGVIVLGKMLQMLSIENFSPGTYHQMYSYQDRDFSGCAGNPHEDPFRSPKKRFLPKLLKNKDIPFIGPYTTLHELKGQTDPADSFFKVGEVLDPVASHKITSF